jgi:ABC-type polar amino acid transport system ATPase subunit
MSRTDDQRPSGSGKSTFLRCINHLEKIDAGRLFVEGQLVGYRQKGDKLHELRPKKAALRAREFMERVRLGDKADHYPAHLSGGQKQRFCHSQCTEKPQSATKPQDQLRKA